MFQKINLKPLSVNEAWKGRKFSTKIKKDFEEKLKLKLKDTELIGGPPFHIFFKFYISSRQDYDNCIKVAQDIICKFYKINDKDILKAAIEKIPTKKGKEWFEFEILSL